MIQRNVVHCCYAGLEKHNRAVALVHFTDENIAVTHPGAGKRRVQVDEVFHIRAVHDRWASSSAVQNPSDHPNRGRLAARARDTNPQSGTVEELSEKTRAGSDGGTDMTRGLHVGDRLLNSGGGDQDLLGSRHAATPDAAKKVIFNLGHRRNLQVLPMRCNEVGARMSKERCRIGVVAPASRMSPEVAEKVPALAGRR